MYNYRPVGIYSAKTLFDKERDRRSGIKGGNFVIYPRIWQDDNLTYNYSFDWNRDGDELLELRAKTKDELLNNCLTGKDEFIKEYASFKMEVNGKEYYPPFLRMFKNHDQVTGKHVILSLIIPYTDTEQVANEKITIDYDPTLFDVGFTQDGKNISSKEFILEKSYFKERDKVLYENTLYPVQFYADKVSKSIYMHNLLIKCKNVISEDKKINFLNSKGDIVGCIVIKENKSAIVSKRNFKYIKLKRKSKPDEDLKTINKRILNTYLLENGKEVKSEDEKEFLTKYTKSLVGNYLSRLTTNFSTDFSIEELEIDNEYLENQAIIGHDKVTKRPEYLQYVEKKYFTEKNIPQEQIKDSIFMFISPIEAEADSSGRFISGYVIYEDIYNISAMLFGFGQDVILHEIAHELGLAHTFESYDKIELTIKSNKDNLESLNQNKNIYTENEKIYEQWKNDLKTRLPQHYPFTMPDGEVIPNKTKWEEKINKSIAENIANIANNEKAITTTQLLIRFFEKMLKLHKITFKLGTTDNIMDYTPFKYGFFNYQYNIIRELNEEFKHI